MYKIKAPDGSNNLCRKNLIKIRNDLGLSQRELALKIQLGGYDVDHHFIRRIENGERFVTDIELSILSKVLSVSIHKLIEEN